MLVRLCESQQILKAKKKKLPSVFDNQYVLMTNFLVLLFQFVVWLATKVVSYWFWTWKSGQRLFEVFHKLYAINIMQLGRGWIKIRQQTICSNYISSAITLLYEAQYLMICLANKHTQCRVQVWLVRTYLTKAKAKTKILPSTFLYYVTQIWISSVIIHYTFRFAKLSIYSAYALSFSLSFSYKLSQLMFEIHKIKWIKYIYVSTTSFLI